MPKVLKLYFDDLQKQKIKFKKICLGSLTKLNTIQNYV
jgi:hypothetical protein